LIRENYLCFVAKIIMKIRIKGNSIRIRLTKTEVENFGKLGVLEDATEFGGSRLVYAIESKSTIDQMQASFENNRITVWIPENIQKEWVSTERIGFENKFDIGDNKQLFLLIEKDFVCLDNTFEDQSDNYPNPNAVC
jgi:hypothetical protein